MFFSPAGPNVGARQSGFEQRPATRWYAWILVGLVKSSRAMNDRHWLLMQRLCEYFSLTGNKTCRQEVGFRQILLSVRLGRRLKQRDQGSLCFNVRLQNLLHLNS